MTPTDAIRGAGLALALALASGTAWAQGAGGIEFDPVYTANCLEDGGWTECIGIASQRCMEFSEDGYSDRVMTECAAFEHRWWGAQLEASVAALIALETAVDTDWGAVPRPSGAETLRVLHGAWQALRDATCAYERLQLFGAPDAAAEEQSCLMRLTAEQALALRHYLNRR